jgi:DDE superfamily endonuclease
MKRIMSLQAWKSGRVRQAAYDGSREFITLNACISAIGTRVPAALLYTGENYDLRHTWVEDLQDDDDFFFGASSNRWSNNDYGLYWLEQVFDPVTRPSSPRVKRLLIVDGHSSHINMAFILKYWDLRIVLLILPPYSTHRLQPLDVLLFGLLELAYSQELNKFQAQSLGLTSIKKRHFLNLFRTAWDTSFTVENIQKAFAKPGIWPFDPQLVLSVITAPITPLPAPEPERSVVVDIKTPKSAKSIRYFQLDYRKNPTKLKLEKLFKANVELSTQVALDQHTKEGLIGALKEEKKSRARGKRLNVLGEEHTKPIYFSAANVRLAQAKMAEKEAFEKSERARIDAKKVVQAENKARKDAEKAAKALQAAVREDNIAEVKIEEKAQKKAQKEKEALQSKALKAIPIRTKTPTKPKRALVKPKKQVRFVGSAQEEGVVASPVKSTSRGRAIKPRKIFEQGTN